MISDPVFDVYCPYHQNPIAHHILTPYYDDVEREILACLETALPELVGRVEVCEEPEVPIPTSGGAGASCLVTQCMVSWFQTHVIHPHLESRSSFQYHQGIDPMATIPVRQCSTPIPAHLPARVRCSCGQVAWYLEPKGDLR